VPFNRQLTGYTILRLCLGVFFLFLGIGKLRWLINSGILAGQLGGWLQASAPASISHRYLTTVAIPLVWLWARLVPIGELACGIAMIAGFRTSVAAAAALVMVLNYHLASGLLFRYDLLTSGYGLPVIGATLALAFGGVRLPWSVRG
jgi:uncharacterized membrane protein YphA (DoxX/SURF4 family)